MYKQSKFCLGNAGLFLSILFGILSIICIVMAGLDFNFTQYKWSEYGIWRFLAPMQISAVVVVFLLFLLGLLNFTTGLQCKMIQLVYCVLIFLSSILSIAVGIISLVGGTIHKDNLTNVCQKEYKGIFSKFQKLDYVMFAVDQVLCSSKCICPRFYNYTAYESFTQDPVYLQDFEKYTFDYSINDDEVRHEYEFSFENCTAKGYAEAYGIYSNYLEAGNGKDDIFKSAESLHDFQKFWKKIENKFKCVGWCNTKYDTADGERRVVKYLFSDINKGASRNRGCMKLISNWLPKILLTYGAFLLVIGLIQVAIYCISIMIYCDCTSEGSNFGDQAIVPKEQANVPIVESQNNQ